MMTADFNTETAFDVLAPAQQRVPFVFNSPHSGRVYPQRFLDLTQLDGWQIRRSEDCFVDELYAGAVGLGAPLLRAHFPRAYLDVNREPLELDAGMFTQGFAMPLNAASPRVAAGLGTVPKLVGEGRPIYRYRLRPQEALMRLETCYFPYHRALRQLIDDTVAQFGFCVLIDCHSMPGQITHPEDGTQPHFIIGDRFGQTASASFSVAAISLLRQAGFTVSHNRPYAGGFITENYGVPAQNVHAIQIEISRRLYLDEARYQHSSNFAAFKAMLTQFCAGLMSLPDAIFMQGQSDSARLAAE
jgi:N-formylglutamate amidohydrolase